jgi:hypothetical protein
MSKAKVEVVFAKKSDEPDGFTVLGSFDVDSDGAALPTLNIPSIGERIVVELPGKDFSGQVISKCTIYSQKDMAEKDWDLVTRILLTVEVDADGPPLGQAQP